MGKGLWILMVFVAPALVWAGGNRSNGSFAKAKIKAAAIYSNLEQKTFYCGCDYQGKKTNLASCGYTPRKNRDRANRIEWEHIVPAQAFGRSFKQWSEGDPACNSNQGKPYKGRRCAEKVSEQYRLIQADLYNLVPAIGEVNGDRSNYSMAEIAGEKRAYGDCDIEIERSKVEPRPAIRGNIARTYLYMDQAYPGREIISKENQKLLEAWDREDPVDLQECQRAVLIKKEQGNKNPLLEQRCSKL